MKRQEKAIVALEAAKQTALEPKAGLGVLMWLDRTDLGTGYRPLMVLRVGRKFVTMFYFPQLMAFRLTYDEWAKLRPERYDMEAGYLLAFVDKQTALYDSLTLRYSTVETATARSLLKGQSANARTATAPGRPSRGVPQGAAKPRAKPVPKRVVSTRRRVPSPV